MTFSLEHHGPALPNFVNCSLAKAKASDYLELTSDDD